MFSEISLFESSIQWGNTSWKEQLKEKWWDFSIPSLDKDKMSDQQKPLIRGQMEMYGQVPVRTNANDIQGQGGSGPHWLLC